MAKINILDKTTIDQIAAGEVVDRPLNVVKELTENAIDSGATAITVEIKDGGTTFIRVTDNGCGIDKGEIKKAFMRHATSKIVDANDLLCIRSLGFRGEALSSICAVSSVECISKTKDELLGIRYVIEGSKETDCQEIGAPCGTTFIVRDLFYNVPARKKFLKSNKTEGSYIVDLMEHLALSKPEISFKLIQNNKEVFYTTGNGNIEEVIYGIYGKDTQNKLIKFSIDEAGYKAYGFLGKPEINRATRNNEVFFVNGRYVQCNILTNAVEEGYKNFLMQHKFPFAVIHFEFDPSSIDVNVHPSKMEIRIHDSKDIYDSIVTNVNDALGQTELIPDIVLEKESEERASIKTPEVFEVNRIRLENPDQEKLESKPRPALKIKRDYEENILEAPADQQFTEKTERIGEAQVAAKPVQMNMFDSGFLSKESKEKYEILGQIFNTYWVVAFEDKLYFMDQHAAHEKVKFERLMKRIKNNEVYSQSINPPIIVTLTGKQMGILSDYEDVFNKLGFVTEDFGLGAIAIREVPTELFGCNETEYFNDILDELSENSLRGNFDVILNKVASMACKAAVKGNTVMNKDQASALLDELLTLDNPYNCPHGRPTIFSMSKYEIEKKFKRIVD